MTPEQTAELFEKCQAARKAAKDESFRNGASPAEAERAADKAASELWNRWASGLIKEREAKGEDLGNWEAGAKAIFSAREFNNGEQLSFAGFVFPGPVDFRDAAFRSPVDFSTAIFHGPADFTGAIFEEHANFEKADFKAGVAFQGATFKSAAFLDARFGKAVFQGSVFDGVAQFSDANFRESSDFEKTIFSANCTFFRRVKFDGKANFENAKFFNVEFDGSTFFYTDFTNAIFGCTTFDDADFQGNIFFKNADFGGEATFENVKLAKGMEASFENAEFYGEANFRSAFLRGRVRFSGATFFRDASFDHVSFRSGAFFQNAAFQASASFELTEFRFATFENAHFWGEANFSAIRGERAFDLADATFEKVPSFIQAHFDEAPRLDNIKVRGRIVEPPPSPEEKWKTLPSRAAGGIFGRLFKAHLVRDIPARWRALKRLAIQGHDADREHEFFAREVRSGRLATDPVLPLAFPGWTLPARLDWLNRIPFVFWRGEPWAGFFRFWFGLFYEWFSGLGRSVLRPFLAWIALVLVFFTYFLGENDYMANWRVQSYGSARNSIEAYASTTFQALNSPPPCYPSDKDAAEPANDKDAAEPVKFTGLVPKARASTDIVKEAFSIAYRNGAVVLDGGGDSTHRSFGCLYGLERYNGNPVAFVPRRVAIASGIQKLLSGVLILLFSLALRNMLKMK